MLLPARRLYFAILKNNLKARNKWWGHFVVMQSKPVNWLVQMDNLMVMIEKVQMEQLGSHGSKNSHLAIRGLKQTKKNDPGNPNPKACDWKTLPVLAQVGPTDQSGLGYRNIDSECHRES
jgi:hypothetical protein